MQWRGLINKFTPEKFDKLCEQLLATLPAENGPDGEVAGVEEFQHSLDELLGLIFDASSRQHQYTQMYTDLTQKLLEHGQKVQPSFNGPSCVWSKCQHIFLTVVLKAPEIPQDLPEDEYMDRKAKIKEKMVGMVKFGGDLVSRGLVPPEGVITWIHTLLSEKTEEVNSQQLGSSSPTSVEVREKDAEQREVQLEVLCAILASMGSSLSDRKTWSEENRSVIEDVFIQLEQLSLDAGNLSLRIRCLIRDILDLKMAAWKEKAYKLKPGLRQSRVKDAEEEHQEHPGGLRDSAPEFIPGKGAWSNDRVTEMNKQWLDPQILSSLQAVEHHLEFLEDKEAKLQRLKALVQLYALIQEKQVVIVANSREIRRLVEMLQEAFRELGMAIVTPETDEHLRRRCFQAFEQEEVLLLVLASEISTRRDCEIEKTADVLVNFDFPMTLQLYLYRIHKRTTSSTQVYTFFSPSSDIRHTAGLLAALEGAGQKVPPNLQKLRDQVRADPNMRKDQGHGHRPSRQAPAQGPPREAREAPRNSPATIHGVHGSPRQRWPKGSSIRAEGAH